MKLFSIFVVALALATTANAQFGFGGLGGLAGGAAGGLARRGLGAAGNGIMNRLGFNQEPPLPEGKMGTSLYNVLKNIPGTDRFLKRTLRALAEYLNALQDDLSNLLGVGGGVDTSNMEPGKAGIVRGALDELRRGFPRLRNAIQSIVENPTNIMNLPAAIVGEVIGSLQSVFGSLFSLLTNGVSYESVIPNSVPALWNLIKAVFSDAMSSPGAVMKLGLKLVAPGPVARFL